MTGRFIGLRLESPPRFADAYHATVRREIGSEQIASAFAIRVLLALLDRLKPARVLEIGSGIGTLTRLLIRTGAELHIAEDSQWCLHAMRQGLSEAERRKISPGLGYLHDLIVVDGPQVTPATARGLLKAGGWMLVEGNRRTWRAGLKYGYRPFVELNLRPFDRSKGVWLLAFEPSEGLRLRFAAERVWQGLLNLTARAWSVLTGASYYCGKRRQVTT